MTGGARSRSYSFKKTFKGSMVEKACRRGVEYDITISLAIMMMRFDAILSALPHGNLRVQCSIPMKACHERSPDMA